MLSYKPPRDQDAFATIRGFAYQVDVTILRWIELEPDEVLELERGEDIDQIIEAVNASDDQFHRTVEQIKHREESVTLRTYAALEAIANAIEHRAANPELKILFRYTTNSRVGKEQHTPVPEKTPLITLWEQVRKGELNGIALAC